MTDLIWSAAAAFLLLCRLDSNFQNYVLRNLSYLSKRLLLDLLCCSNPFLEVLHLTIIVCIINLNES